MFPRQIARLGQEQGLSGCDTRLSAHPRHTSVVAVAFLAGCEQANANPMDPFIPRIAAPHQSSWRLDNGTRWLHVKGKETTPVMPTRPMRRHDEMSTSYMRNSQEQPK